MSVRDLDLEFIKKKNIYFEYGSFMKNRYVVLNSGIFQ